MNTGRIVYDLGGRAAAAGPTSEAALATAEAIGAATVAALELPAAALGLETGDGARWCRV